MALPDSDRGDFSCRRAINSSSLIGVFHVDIDVFFAVMTALWWVDGMTKSLLGSDRPTTEILKIAIQLDSITMSVKKLLVGHFR